LFARSKGHGPPLALIRFALIIVYIFNNSFLLTRGVASKLGCVLIFDYVVQYEVVESELAQFRQDL
jgi:hypothetical protein